MYILRFIYSVYYFYCRNSNPRTSKSASCGTVLIASCAHHACQFLTSDQPETNTHSSPAWVAGLVVVAAIA